MWSISYHNKKKLVRPFPILLYNKKFIFNHVLNIDVLTSQRERPLNLFHVLTLQRVGSTLEEHWKNMGRTSLVIQLYDGQ
jgi:hypothetical protein